MTSENAANRAQRARAQAKKRLRSDGVLSAEEAARHREQGIALGYDCAQIGWVPLDCIDDFDASPLADSTQVEGTALAEAVVALDERALGQRIGGLPNHRASQLERASGVVASAFRYRPWRAEDAPRYRELLDDPDVWRHLPEAFPGPIDDALAKSLIELSNLGEHHEVRAVEHEGQVVGQVRLVFHTRYQTLRVAEVAYVLGKPYQGHGLMGEILDDYTERSFRRHDLDAICAFIHPAHVASIRCAERCGYQRAHAAHEPELAEHLGRPGFIRYLCLGAERSQRAVRRARAHFS